MKRSRINPVSSKRRKRDAVYPERRRQVFDRAEGRCEAMAGMWCTGRCENVHHKAGRLGEDPHALDGLVGICGPCHRWVHDNPGEAYELGLMARRNGGDA